MVQCSSYLWGYDKDITCSLFHCFSCCALAEAVCSREHSLASLFGTSVRLRLDYIPRL
jgi:hypothetical protein